MEQRKSASFMGLKLFSSPLLLLSVFKMTPLETLIQNLDRAWDHSRLL